MHIIESRLVVFFSSDIDDHLPNHTGHVTSACQNAILSFLDPWLMGELAEYIRDLPQLPQPARDSEMCSPYRQQRGVIRPRSPTDVISSAERPGRQQRLQSPRCACCPSSSRHHVRMLGMSPMSQARPTFICPQSNSSAQVHLPTVISPALSFPFHEMPGSASASPSTDIVAHNIRTERASSLQIQRRAPVPTPVRSTEEHEGAIYSVDCLRMLRIMRPTPFLKLTFTLLKL